MLVFETVTVLSNVSSMPGASSTVARRVFFSRFGKTYQKFGSIVIQYRGARTFRYLPSCREVFVDIFYTKSDGLVKPYPGIRNLGHIPHIEMIVVRIVEDKVH